MKKSLIIGLVVLCVIAGFSSCNSKSTSDTASGVVNVKDPETLEERSAYSMGGLIYNSNGSYLGLTDSNIGAFLRGMYDASQNKFLYTDDEAQNYITEYSEVVLSKMQTENLEASEAFLASNKSAPGVVETDSGLQYEVLTEGTGPKAGESNTVDVYYKLMNLDGEVLEEVNAENGPVSFPVNQLVPGVIEGLKLMNVGSKYRFWVKPSLGYGETGAGVIEPNQLLVFEFELIEVK